jgi:hypothetical protein
MAIGVKRLQIEFFPSSLHEPELLVSKDPKSASGDHLWKAEFSPPMKFIFGWDRCRWLFNAACATGQGRCTSLLRTKSYIFSLRLHPGIECLIVWSRAIGRMHESDIRLPSPSPLLPKILITDGRKRSHSWRLPTLFDVSSCSQGLSRQGVR